MKRHRHHFPVPKTVRVMEDSCRDPGRAEVFLGVEQRRLEKRILIREKVDREAIKKSARVAKEALRLVFVRETVSEVKEMHPQVMDSQVGERVSVVIPFRGMKHLEGLKKCIKSIRDEPTSCYIILVEQDYAPLFKGILEPLVDRYLFTPSQSLFNKSWAMNCGVVLAPDELVMLHDCDVVISRNYIREAVQLLGSDDLALPWARALYLDEGSSRRHPQGPVHVLFSATNDWACGLTLLVRKSFFLSVGGFDERFEGWGEEDRAFFIKVCKLGRVKKADPVRGPVLVHYHHEPASGKHDHKDVNYGMFTEYQNNSAEQIRQRVRELGPIGDPLKPGGSIRW